MLLVVVFVCWSGCSLLFAVCCYCGLLLFVVVV